MTFGVVLSVLGDVLKGSRDYGAVDSIMWRIKRSPLTITFDPKNPSRRFWSVESIVDGNGKASSFWEYRVDVTNTSRKTVKNVSLTTEHTGKMPQKPSDSNFDKTLRTACDLKPGCSELVTIVRWPIPIRQAGVLAGPTALEYGPVKVIASGDDVKPVTALFKFNYEEQPMLEEIRTMR